MAVVQRFVVDVVVLGAGTAGANAAGQLAERGLRVVLLERRAATDAGAQWHNGVLDWQFVAAGVDPPVPPERAPSATRTHIVGPDGTVTSGPTTVPTVDTGIMVHDFVITPRYLVLVLAPVVFDLDAMTTGGDVLSWQPDRGTRIALVPRDGSEVRWIETEPFFVWHFGNAFDDGDDVAVDFSWWSSFSLGIDPDRTGAFTQMRLSPSTGRASLTHLDGSMSEFARIDDRLCGRPHRYVTVSQKSGRHEGLLSGEFDRLVRYDLETGRSVHYDGDLVHGEVVHAPRAGAAVGRGDTELDGWYLTYGTDLSARHSYFLVWDAQDFPSDPVAKVRMPRRIPNGLHGNWMPAEV